MLCILCNDSGKDSQKSIFRFQKSSPTYFTNEKIQFFNCNFNLNFCNGMTSSTKFFYMTHRKNLTLYKHILAVAVMIKNYELIFGDNSIYQYIIKKN